MNRARRGFLVAAAVAAVAVPLSCVEPPPKISAIPPGGLALKVYVFGASAQEARRTFEAAKQTNQNFSVVNEGGDGEVLVGLENDSPKCVPPTALCSYRVAYRVRSYKGEVVAQGTTSVSANADRCADLCAKALNNMVVKVIEAAATALKSGGASADDGGGEDAAPDGGEGEPSPSTASSASAAGVASAPTSAPPRGKKAPFAKKPEPTPAKPPPAICAVASGPRLAADEAERRSAQVEVLKRLNVIDQEEYDCLRKAYLDRL